MYVMGKNLFGATVYLTPGGQWEADAEEAMEYRVLDMAKKAMHNASMVGIKKAVVGESKVWGQGELLAWRTNMAYGVT